MRPRRAPIPLTDPTYEIIPVLCGSITDVERSNLTLKHHTGEQTSIPSILWIIRSQSETIILDAGPGDPEVVRTELGRSFETDGDLVEKLAAVGVDPTAVKTV